MLQIEKIGRDDPAADDYARRALLSRLRQLAFIRRFDDANPGRRLFERLMDAACLAKSAYNPGYVTVRQLIEEVAPDVIAHFPSAGEDALRRARHLLNAG
jgi:hypothetical protein